MDRDKNLKDINRDLIYQNYKIFDFSQIEFSTAKKLGIKSKTKDNGPFYSPFSKRFYEQKLIYRDEDLGLIIQFDVILMWVIFGVIFIWSVFF